MKLTDWAALAAAELDLPDAPDRIDRAAVDRILDLSRDAAHNVARPAAPLTAYVLGLAVGAGMDAEDAAARLTALALAQGSGTDDADSGG